MPYFLGIERLSLGPWQAFERAIQRFLFHAGFDDLLLVGGTGDGGADVVANRNGKTLVIQAKYRSKGTLLGPDPIQEVAIGAGKYDAQIAVVATNTGFTESAIDKATELEGDLGLKFLLWNRDFLAKQFSRLPRYSIERNDPRPYQVEAIQSVNAKILHGGTRALLLMATGLGKTRVAAGTIEQWIEDRPRDQVLVLSPSLSLVPQLEAELWPYLPKSVATHVLTGFEKPSFEGGVTVATEQSMLQQLPDAHGRYGLVVVDEAHHAPADGYSRLIEELNPQFLLGMTATPWRGDRRHLEDIFGEPTYAASIVDGMQLGYLSKVDYRMLVDDIDWDWVRSDLGETISVRELNRNLFVPERDEAMVMKIRSHLRDIDEPRTLVFCRSIRHAETVRNLLLAEGLSARVLHSKLGRFEAAATLRAFRSGQMPILVTVDMVNEGIDIPDVNFIVFLRVTHSRRIFLQQLGRGLRITKSKDSVRVLDFVSDVRRIAEAMRMNREAHSAVFQPGSEPVVYPTGEVVNFEGDQGLDFFQEYLADVAELEEGSDDSRLKFPAETHH